MTLSRPLLIGLIASATLNVFLVGGVAGVLWVREAAPKSTQAPAPAPISAAVPAPPPSQPVTPAPAVPASSTGADVAETLAQPPRAAPAPRPASAPAAPVGEAPARPPLWMAGRGLSDQSRQALRRTLREANQRNQPITRQARAERRAALVAFRATPYDPATVSQHLSTARTLDGQARTNVEAALSTFAATLSVEERAALAEGLAQVYAPRAPAETDAAR